MKVLATLCGGMMVMSGAAFADYVCQTNDAGWKIQTFSLTEDTEELRFQLETPVAALVKGPIGKSLFTGTVHANPVRVGDQYGFGLLGPNQEELRLTVQRFFHFSECTRAGCAEPLETYSGWIFYQGESQAVSCETSPL